MGEYADEMIDRMLDWDDFLGTEFFEGPTTEQIAGWHAEQNRKAAEEALDEALADEEDNDDD